MVQENCQRQRIPRTHSEAGTNPQDRWSQWRTSWWTGRRVSTDTNHRWRGSPCRFLVDPRWLHLSSSQWTTGSTLRAEGRNISHPTEIYWWNLVYSYWTGCVTREANRRLQEWRLGQIFVRLTEKDSRNSFHTWKEKPPKGLTKIQTTTRPDHERPEIWTKSGKARQNREIQEWAKEKPKLDNARKWEEFTLLIHKTKNTKKLSRMRRETGKTHGTNYAV